MGLNQSDDTDQTWTVRSPDRRSVQRGSGSHAAQGAV